MVEQMKPEYKEISRNIALNVYGLLVSVRENDDEENVKSFLCEDLHVIHSQIFEKTLNAIRAVQPTNHANFFEVIEKKIIVNSFSLKEIKIKHAKVLEFSKEYIKNDDLKKFCNL